MKSKYNVKDIIDFVTNSDSELSDLSDDDEFVADEDQSYDHVLHEETSSDSDDSEDEIPLADLLDRQNEGNVETEENNNPNIVIDASVKNHTYRWRRQDIPTGQGIYRGTFSDPPDEPLSPLQYFHMFFPESLISKIVEQTNLYSVQTTGRNVNTNVEEMTKYIGMNLLMGIVKLPTYFHFWSQTLRYPGIADHMSRNRFSSLKRFLHFVDNNADNDSNDKLAKVRPVIDAVRDCCVLVEPEEFHSIDEQIIPSKTKYSKIRQYNPKKPKKWGFKNLVRAGASGFMYDFYVYDGRDISAPGFNHLQKSAQVVAKLSLHLPNHVGHKLFFDNWFTTLDLMLYLKRIGIKAVGTVRTNRIHGCPLEDAKVFKSKDRGHSDYRTDKNSGVILVKWLDNSAVLLASNFIGVEPQGTIERWDKKANERKQVPCPAIVKSYNKSMGGVDLADMLISLYRIQARTKRWYIKVFWHLVDIAKVNAWILYKRHYTMSNQPKGKMQTLVNFSKEIADSLIMANKVVVSSKGRPKRRSLDQTPEETERPAKGKKPTVPIPCGDIRYDSIGHFPCATKEKSRCRHCKSYIRMKCIKCKVFLCVLVDRNCFQDFHQK